MVSSTVGLKSVMLMNGWSDAYAPMWDSVGLWPVWWVLLGPVLSINGYGWVAVERKSRNRFELSLKPSHLPF